MSGVDDDRLAIWLASITAFTNFSFTLVGVWLVEKVGRRKLTLGSLTGTCHLFVYRELSHKMFAVLYVEPALYKGRKGKRSGGGKLRGPANRKFHNWIR